MNTVRLFNKNEPTLHDSHNKRSIATIRGIAALFYDPSVPATTIQYGRLHERFGNTLFDRSLAEKHYVYADANHAVDKSNGVEFPLATTKNDTLRLTKTDKGLSYEFDVADTTRGRDLVALCERGDYQWCSFGIRDPKVFYQRDSRFGDIRTYVDANLYEISISREPACDATTAELFDKQAEQLDKEYRRWLATQEFIEQIRKRS